MMTGI